MFSSIEARSQRKVSSGGHLYGSDGLSEESLAETDACGEGRIDRKCGLRCCATIVSTFEVSIRPEAVHPAPVLVAFSMTGTAYLHHQFKTPRRSLQPTFGTAEPTSSMNLRVMRFLFSPTRSSAVGDNHPSLVSINSSEVTCPFAVYRHR